MGTAFNESRHTVDEPRLGTMLETHGVPRQYARGVTEAVADLFFGAASNQVAGAEVGECVSRGRG